MIKQKHKEFIEIKVLSEIEFPKILKTIHSIIESHEQDEEARGKAMILKTTAGFLNETKQDDLSKYLYRAKRFNEIEKMEDKNDIFYAMVGKDVL